MAEGASEPEHTGRQAASARRSDDGAGLPMAQRVVVTTLGVGCVALGAVATFTTSNGAGSATLVGGGLGLIVVAFLGNRLESLKFGGVEATIRAAEHLYVRADDLAADGHDEQADTLRAEADRLLMRAAPDARAYETLRRTEAPGPRRTARFSEVVRKAQQYSREHRPGADSVRSMFLKGEDGDRVFALVLMQEDPSAADLEAILEAIGASRSAFEQYQAVVAAERLVRIGLDRQSRGRLRDALTEQLGPGGWINPTTGRWTIVQRTLAALQDSGDG